MTPFCQRDNSETGNFLDGVGELVGKPQPDKQREYHDQHDDIQVVDDVDGHA